MDNHFAEQLLAWYSRHARVLPWRDHPSPYAVWVSEIMLQQTRVDTVIPYFTRWMERFPSLVALARADIDEVLKTWEGLGYYRRAHNIHLAARILVTESAGEIPSNPDELQKLPGVGTYTARAIASLAFGLDTPALDGNVRRVLARVFNLTEHPTSPQGRRTFEECALAVLPQGKAASFNQALMDLGSLVCTPKNPKCTQCPLAEFCQAQILGIQENLPVKKKKKPLPHYTVTAGVVRRNKRVLITQRPLGGLLGGLWEFPGGKRETGEDLAGCLQRELREELGIEVVVGAEIGVYRHAYTHFRVTLHAFGCKIMYGAEPQPIQVADLRWVFLAELVKYPMGKIDRMIAIQLNNAG